MLFYNDFHLCSARLARRIKSSFCSLSLDAVPRTAVAFPPTPKRLPSDEITAETEKLQQLLNGFVFDVPAEVELIEHKKRSPKDRWDVFDLDTEALTDADSKMTSHGRLDDEFVRKFHIPITRKDLRTLYHGRWLNDEVCNFYFELIKERNDKAGAMPNNSGAGRLPKVHIFNTHFFKLYVDRGYDHVKRWTKKFDLFTLDMVLIPVNLSDTHWTIIVSFAIRLLYSILVYMVLFFRNNRKSIFVKNLYSTTIRFRLEIWSLSNMRSRFFAEIFEQLFPSFA